MWKARMFPEGVPHFFSVTAAVGSKVCLHQLKQGLSVYGGRLWNSNFKCFTSISKITIINKNNVM